MAFPFIDNMDNSLLSWQGELLNRADPRCAVLFEPSSERMFYEVIRVTSGVPLFWEDHLARLRASVAGEFALPRTLREESLQLIAAGGLTETNLRLVLTAKQRVLHLSPSYYPDDAMRRLGVPAGILKWERENPNTKVVLADYKAAVAARFAAPGPLGRYFELLLEDSNGYLTEGSRSNLFFLMRTADDSETVVLSAPESRILKGITRKYVLQAISSAGARLQEGLLKFSDLQEGRAEAAFITGSPIDVLAVSAVESVKLGSADHLLLGKIDAAYRKIVADYIAKAKQNGTINK